LGGGPWGTIKAMAFNTRSDLGANPVAKQRLQEEAKRPHGLLAAARAIGFRGRGEERGRVEAIAAWPTPQASRRHRFETAVGDRRSRDRRERALRE
jgi:hypothetical protein